VAVASARPPAGAVVGVGGHHGTGLVAHRGEDRLRLALEGVEEEGVAVAHHVEDVIDLVSQAEHDVGGDGGHQGPLHT